MVDKIDDGGPAFARAGAEHSQGGNFEQDGMSLRDWFAGQALAGFCANGAVFASNDQNGWDLVNCTTQQLTQTAFALADVMIFTRKGGA